MDSSVLLFCCLIILGRILDVSLGTLRTVFVVQGRRSLSWVLGFCEILIWLFVISHVVQNLQQPAYAISYALGYATGNYVGVVLEQWVALGEQVVRVFTHHGAKITAQLRAEGFRVTAFPAEGRDGPLEMLFLEIPRKKARDIILHAEEIDPHCFCIVEDIRQAIPAAAMLHQPTGWRAVTKKK
jgi:uncharacterized protein YebE (UPF0316 family)